VTILVPDGAAMERLGRQLASSVCQPGVIYFQGELGTGKTTLVRSLLRGCGYAGKVRSPTYTLVEPYPLGELTVYHLDLYRLAAPDELEWLGIRDLLAEPSLLLVEWPERGGDQLPVPDLILSLDYQDHGRRVTCRMLTARGRKLAQGLPAGCLQSRPVTDS
jgi:tRNA threonylcarbamoyladenosine biosynthesis protein TsaE